jgi:hypothetical protein
MEQRAGVEVPQGRLPEDHHRPLALREGPRTAGTWACSYRTGTFGRRTDFAPHGLRATAAALANYCRIDESASSPDDDAPGPVADRDRSVVAEIGQ